MNHQQLEQSVGNLAREFFRAKLGRVPKSLEVRAVERLLIVRIEGFLSPADKMSMERATAQRDLEHRYARLFGHMSPLVEAGMGTNGASPLDFQTILDLRNDKCVFVWTLMERPGPSSSRKERAMWPFGKIRCPVCGEQFSKQEMRLSPGERRVGVCRHCFDGWSTRGRTCGRCGQPVTGNQSVAVFPELRSIGHFDCGGVPVASH
jgi:uncharacterized protein YbcI